MREFEFVVEFDQGTDELMDVFQEHSGLSARSSACMTTHDHMWRIDHIQGPSDALADVEAVYTDEHRCNECLDEGSCETHREYHILDRTAHWLTVYTFRHEVHNCYSIPYIVYDHVGDGVVFEAQRVANAYRWKVLYPDDQPVGELFDAIDDVLRPGLSLEVSHLREAGRWDPVTRATAAITPEQWAVLEAALDAGYYERPRETTVQELSDDLDLPRSTLQYRLRNAEDTVIETFLETA